MLRMKEERLRRGWSQTVVAYRAHVSVAEVSRIETGRTRPYPGQLKRIARVLGVTPETLLEESDSTAAGSVAPPSTGIADKPPTQQLRKILR